MSVHHMIQLVQDERIMYRLMATTDEIWEYILVGAGLLILGVYHVWLLYTIIRYPGKTVIGINAESRHQWVRFVMSDPKNGVLAVQTLRNNLMASTGLASISITLSSLISAYVSSTTSSSTLTSQDPSLTSGSSNSSTTKVYTFKYFAILLCFLLAFFGFMQHIRYYAHVSFLVNSPPPRGRKHHVQYVFKILNRGNQFWSLGMRAFYVSFPMLLWIFGALQMLLSSCFVTIVLYFLDTPNWFSSEPVEEEERDLEITDSDGDSNLEDGGSKDWHLSSPLLRDARR